MTVHECITHNWFEFVDSIRTQIVCVVENEHTLPHTVGYPCNSVEHLWRVPNDRSDSSGDHGDIVFCEEAKRTAIVLGWRLRGILTTIAVKVDTRVRRLGHPQGQSVLEAGAWYTSILSLELSNQFFGVLIQG